MKNHHRVLLLVFLVGCSEPNQQGAIRDRQLDYQAAYVEPKLKVPDGLSNERVNESLRIPGINEPTAGLYGGSFEAPRADGALRTQTLTAIRRHLLGEIRWLSIPEDPSAVWPELERFVSENKLTVFYSRVEKGTQVLESDPFRGTEAYSGSRIIRHFSPALGSIVLRFFLESGLRNGTSEVRIDMPAGRVDGVYIDRILDEFKSYLEQGENRGRAVSRAISLVEAGNRMKLRRIDGLDELVIQAQIPRVFGVIVEAVKDIGATIDGGDLDQGLLNIRYVRKATEQRLAAMSTLNRAIATTIEDPVGSYQIVMQEKADGLVLKAVPTGLSASIGGATELIREFRERLY